MAKEQSLPKAWGEINALKSGKLDKSGGTMSGNLTISKDSYPSIFIENTNPSYNKTLRMEHSQNNVLRFIKYKDLSTTTADKILDWNMSAGGVIYHTGNKPTASDVGIQNDYLNDFDGTYGDFCDKNKYGTFSIGPSTFDKLNLPSGTYKYGILIVECSHNGDRMNLTYISDNSNQIFNYNSWNFKNNPTTIFNTNKWTNSFTTQNSPISKAQNGYCKLANGLIIQWGNHTNGDGTRTITLPIAFSDNKYTIAHSLNYSDDTGIATTWTNNATITGAKTTTSFRIGTGITTRILGIAWIAIGH